MSLIETKQAPTSPALPNTLRLGEVHLTVADLDRSVAWYQRSRSCQPIRRRRVAGHLA